MSTDKPPIWFWIISVIGLLWNLSGVYMFFATQAPDYVNDFTPEQQEVMAAAPDWLMIPFGIAVATGVLGCVALLMRKKWAQPLLLISIICVLIQQGYSAFMTKSFEVFGAEAIGLVSALVVIGLLLYWLAKKMNASGWAS